MASQLYQPMQHIKMAKQSIDALPDSKVGKCSSIYQSQALTLDDEPQDDYFNAVIELHTQLSAELLLDALQAIEATHGRVREKRWGARTLDLDIILFGDQLIQTQRLTVPHSEMLNRDFVLLPLYEIAPETVIPSFETAGNKTLKELIKNYSESSLTLVGDFNE